MIILALEVSAADSPAFPISGVGQHAVLIVLVALLLNTLVTASPVTWAALRKDVVPAHPVTWMGDSGVSIGRRGNQVTQKNQRGKQQKGIGKLEKTKQK